MKKTVNLYARMPVALRYTILRGNRFGISLDTEEIRKLLYKKVVIDEVLSDGSTVRLDFTNYDKVNRTAKEIAAEEAAKKAAEEAKIAEAKRLEEEAKAKAEAERKAAEERAKAEAEAKRIAEEEAKKAAAEAEARRIKAAEAKRAMEANKNKQQSK